MIAVYIASPYSKGDIAHNIRQSLWTAERLIDHGFLPFTPLLSHFWHIISPHPYEYWMKLDIDWLKRCDCVLRLPGDSDGADAEVRLAYELNILVYYSIEELLEYPPKE